MTQLTRRGLLGMFAAGVGAAVLPSGVIMPVKKVWTPPLDFGMWQDAAMTIPAVKSGDPVMVATRRLVVDGVYYTLTAPSRAAAPTLCFEAGIAALAFDGVDDCLISHKGIAKVSVTSSHPIYIGLRNLTL